MTSPLPSISGLADLAGRYDAVLSDVWGVVHNGVAAFPPAVDALVQYRQAGGKVVFITNAPRPSAPLIDMLDRLGVTRDAYDAIVSSGDATRVMIAKYAGKAIHHVGPPTEDDALYDGLDVRRSSADEAQAVVVTDLDSDDDTPEMYRERARHWLSRKLPMICANPDRVVEHGDKIIYCGGALGDLYAAMGGMVLMAGKPYRPIYEEAFRLAETAAGKPLDGPLLDLLNQIRLETVEDFSCNPPDIIIEDRATVSVDDFDLLGVFEQEPRFAAIMASYAVQSTLEPFTVYQRIAPLPAPTGACRTIAPTR